MAGHPLGLQKSGGGARPWGCPNSSVSVPLPIHPPARAGADPRPRPRLAAGSGKGWLCRCRRTNLKPAAIMREDAPGGDLRSDGAGDPRAAPLFHINRR